jgi:hypothetical protein
MSSNSYPSVVLIELHGMPEIQGIPLYEPEARDRKKTNPGDRIVGKTQKVKIGSVIVDLVNIGLAFREARCEVRKGKKVVVLIFAKEHQKPSQKVPSSIVEFTEEGVFNFLLSVFSNHRRNGKKQYRLDAILLSGFVKKTRSKANAKTLRYKRGEYFLK